MCQQLVVDQFYLKPQMFRFITYEQKNLSRQKLLTIKVVSHGLSNINFEFDCFDFIQLHFNVPNLTLAL